MNATQGFGPMRPEFTVIASSRGGNQHEQWGRWIEVQLNAAATRGFVLHWANLEGYHFTAILSRPIPVQMPVLPSEVTAEEQTSDVG